MTGKSHRGTGVGTNTKNVLVVTYWCYSDALIQTYTLPYVRIILKYLPEGSKVHLVTLEKGEHGNTVQEDGIIHHPFQYHALGVSGAFMILKLVYKLVRLVGKKRIDTIHAWCTTAGMIGYLVSKITGQRLILDSYEPHAEAMVENGTWSPKGFAFKTLFYFEKAQSLHAQVLIAAAEGMRGYALEKYGVQKEHFYIKPACVDLEKFGLHMRKDPLLINKLGLKNKIVIVYAGKLGGIYLGQEIFDLIKVAYLKWGDDLRVLLLTGQNEKDLENFMNTAGLSRDLFVITFVEHSEVPMYMGLGDIALTPVKSVPTKRFCTPVKDGEYWALGIPVIITPNISDDSSIIEKHNIGAVLEGLDASCYAKAIDKISDYLETVPEEERSKGIREVAKVYRNYSIANAIYQKIYEG